MTKSLHTIRLSMPLRMGWVNCYLLTAGDGFVLVDSGSPSCLKQLRTELENAGCIPGSLRLIVITHGDFDHTGCAAALRTVYDAPIAMHPGDLGMAQDGDMFYNRKPANVILRKLIPLLTGFGKKERFTPDVLLEDGQSLEAWGCAAKVISIPGHSKGSVGVLTADGDLLCGDLLVSSKSPQLNSLMDDPSAGATSLQRLRDLPVRRVYPGHGEPFGLEQVPG